MRQKFYGWWVVAATFVTFGLAVGVPYYNISFFYDYFQRDFGWTRADITLGFPLAAIFTIWAGPLVMHRFSPRRLILVGTGLTAITLMLFSRMGGALWFYYLIWGSYVVGYILSGPIPHQIIVSQWFRRNRGKAMGVLYVGVGLLGFLGSFLVKPLTQYYGYRFALMFLGGMVLVAWPLVLIFVRDKPSDMGQNPDGDEHPPAEVKLVSRSFSELLGSYPFWLLVIGSVCSIGSIGAVNFHMKFVFLDQGFEKGPIADSAWRLASMIILASSIGGRLVVGYLADKFPKKWVMFASYFVTASTVPLLLMVHPGSEAALWVFSLMFGFGMGADYMMIPLMAAEQFGVNSLARAMAIILPANTIGQTWFPYIVSLIRERMAQDYHLPMYTVLAVAMLGAVAILLLPRRKP